MANVIGIVGNVSGKFFVKDEQGNIREVKPGDKIFDGEVLYGSEQNSPNDIVQLKSDDGRIIVIDSTVHIQLDQTLLNTIPNQEMVKITPETLSQALNVVDTTTNENQNNTEQEAEQTTINPDEEVDTLKLEFVDRVGDQTDINSDLRVSDTLNGGAIQAKFHGLKTGEAEDFTGFINRTGDQTDVNSNLRYTETNDPTYSPDQITYDAANIAPLYGVLQLDGDLTVPEGNSATYTLSVDNPPKSDLVITVEISHKDTVDLDVNPITQTFIILEGQTSTTFTIDNLDDIMAEGPEDYIVTLKSTTGGDYTELTIGNDEVTTTINDDSNTPNNQTDGIENSHELVQIKLVACDSNGNPILDSDGKTYTFVNEVNEDNAASYMALAFDPNTTTYTTDTKLDTQIGTVTVSTTDLDATQSADYVNTQTQTVTLDTAFSIDTLDDYLSDNGEKYKVSIDSNSYAPTIGGYENVNIDGTVTTTIIDNSKNTPNSPYDEVDPANPPVETDLDTITIKLFAIDENGNRSDVNTVAEGSDASYVAVAFDKDGNEVLTNESVEVTFGATGDTASKDGVDYTSTTQTVTLGQTFTTPTTDDFISDNDENYKVQITDETLSNASNYETVVIDTTPVTTTIIDNTNPNTPNDPTDTIETNADKVIIKLIALDSNGDPILNSGNYTFANEVSEGIDAKYMALAFEPDETVFNPSTKLSIQVGTIDISFSNATATGANAQTQIDGTQDFNNTAQTTITLGSVITTATFDDFLSDNGETYTISIDAGSYTRPTPTTGYEDVAIDTTPVTTTIIDGTNDETPNQDVDTVYVQLDTNDSVKEQTDGTLTHQLHLVDKDGNAVNLANGETIEVTLAYSSDSTEAEDFSTKTTTVTITGDGTNTYSFDNTIVDDFLSEGDESYTVKIDSISNAGTYFENVQIDTANNEATGIITDAKTGNDETPNQDVDTVYAVLTGDTSVNEGSTTSYTVELLDKDGNSVTVSQNTVVNVTFTNGSTQDADTQYSNNDNIAVTIIAGNSSVVLSTDTVDDYMSDNNENYTLTIDSIPNHEFEAIDIDGFTDTNSVDHVATQTTTILDNTGTPNNDTNPETEDNLDIVEIKLIACDTSGNKLTDGNGNYIVVNEVNEGDHPNYMALAFVPGTTTFNASTETPTQEGTVAVTLSNSTATGTSSFTPTFDGSEDYDNDGQTVTLGMVFSTSTFDDFFSDDGETFTVQITDGSYTSPTATTGYENVNINTDPVTTTIRDDISFGTPDDSYVDEDNFDVTDSNTSITGGEHNNNGVADADGNSSDGTATLLNIITADGTKDDYSIIFDTTIAPALTSAGTNIVYDYSTVGTVIGYLDGGNSTDDKVFQIVLDKHGAGGSDDGYTYTQYANIDHPTANDDDTITFDMGFKIIDDGQTSNTQNFTITVNDSLPNATDQNLTTNEGSDLLIVVSQESFENGQITINNNVSGGDQVLNTGDTINIYSADGDDVVGVVTNNGDGTLTFSTTTTDVDYSGGITPFNYVGVKDSDGDEASAQIDITVTPVADTPDMNGANANLSESTITTTQVKEDDDNTNEGGLKTTIGFILPTITDDADITGNDADNDEIEKFGLIEIQSNNGVIITANGTDYTVTGGKLTVYINDVTDYHYLNDDLTTLESNADISLTQAQFEAIQVIHSEDDAVNPTFTISADSYEVNDDDTLKAGPIKANNTQDYEVDILAVTDPVSLVFSSNNDGDGDNTTETFATADEDSAGTIIDLAAILSASFGETGDDGSEQRSYIVSDIPEGTILNLGGNKVAAGSDGVATINFPDNSDESPTFTMTIAPNYSGTINGTITLQALDTDNDSTGTITAQTDAVTFTMTVDPVADDVTLQVKQAVGDEDAGRTTGNTANDATADDIDDAINGIDLDIKVTSDDDKDISDGTTTDAKETYTVIIGDNTTYDGIPDGASIYYNGTIVDKDTANGGGFTITDNGGSWKLQIDNFDNDAPLTFIPPHNDDSDYIFNVDAYSTDAGSDSVTQTLQIDVTVNEVADIPVDDTLGSVNVASDSNGNIAFNLSTTEDSSINLKNVLATPATLASYDSDSSENLTIKVTNLADGFSLSGSGATFITGSGTSRVWFIDVAELNNDNVTLTTPSNYAGETTFDMYMITTEDAGDSKTHPVQNVSIMITPVAEATINTSDTQNEDETITLDFALTKPDNDDASSGVEILKTFAIDMDTVDAGVTLVGSVSGTISGTGYQSLNVDANGNLETVTATITEDSNMGGSYNFNIKYTIDDTATDSNGNIYTNTKTVTDEVYTVTVNAITDDITLSATTSTSDSSITIDGDNISVSDNGSFTKSLSVVGVDSDGRGNTDEDGSEKFTRIEVSGVPEGITVVDGVYAGDTGGGNYSGFWYVDIIDVDLDGSATYDLVFDVDGDLSDGTSSTIKIKVFNEDSSNGVEQDDEISFHLDVSQDVAGIVGTPAEITKFYQNIDQDTVNDGDDDATQNEAADHDYILSTSGGTTIDDTDAYDNSVLREDVQFNLSDVIHIETDNTDSNFSITLKNVPDNVAIEGMTYNSTDSYYTLSGYGNQSAVVSALQNILVTPISNANTDATDIANTDLNFDIELTTYATGGASNTALINFTGSILPVTDAMTFTTINDGSTTEDTDQIFSVTLDNDADGNKTTIIDGKVYIQVTETYNDTQGADGANGVLKDGSGNAITTTETDPTGLPAGTYFVVSGVSYNDTLDFIYTPASNRDGSVDVNLFVKNIENESWDPYNTTEMVSTKTVSFDVSSVRDGFTFDTATGTTGTEDTMVQVNVTVTNPDSSELLTSVSLDKIPDGFLVYYGADEASAVVAQNIGVNGQMTMQMIYGVDETVDYNLWNIPLTNGEIPAYIGIKAPENWSGTIPQVIFHAADESGDITTNAFDVVVSAVVDTLTLNTTKTFGSEGEDVALNLNANVDDLDGSETVTLTLAGFGDANASFKADGVAIDSNNISYDAGNDIYTISQIAALDLNKLTVTHATMGDTTITATAKMVESDGSESSVVNTNNTFNINISESIASSGDDTLLYKGIAIDGLAGIDTLALNGTAIDYANITNMEILDLGAGDNTLANLSLQNVIDMTDSNNDLIILGDSADSVSLANSSDWTLSSDNATETINGVDHTIDTWTNNSDSSVTIKVDDSIDGI